MSGWRKRDPHDGVGVAAKPVPEANLFKGGLTKNLLKNVAQVNFGGSQQLKNSPL